MISIAITGAESSGKTTLANQLNAYFSRSVLVPEFAREYMLANNLAGNYSREDVLHMAGQQWQATEEARECSPEILICDTEQLVLYIWDNEVFRTQHSEIHSRFLSEKFDLYFLCSPDLPWQPDPLRENEHDRDRLFERFRDELSAAKKNYVIISGGEQERLQRAIEWIEKAYDLARSRP